VACLPNAKTYIKLAFYIIPRLLPSASIILLLGVFLIKREHELVPVHRIMNKSEIEELLNKLGLKVSNLPKILFSDPQARKIGAQVGDVLEIDRDDFGKQYKYYRQVAES